MALIKRSIKWDPAAYAFVAREATAVGVPVSEYVRVAAIIRATIDLARRDPARAAQLGALTDTVAESVRGYLGAQHEGDAR